MNGKAHKYVTFIVDELKKGNVKYKDVFKVFLSEFKSSEPTFAKYWKMANVEFSKVNSEAEEKKHEAFIKDEVEQVAKGLRPKHIRMEELQFSIDRIKEVIEKGVTKDSYIDYKKSTAIEIERPLTEIEKGALEKVSKELTAELNKMDGSYDPAETKTTITDTRPPAKVKLPDGTEIEV
jgi:hypothetical protein